MRRLTQGSIVMALILAALPLQAGLARPNTDYRQVGIASWYGPGFHGRPTASGERFDQNRLTAAHRDLPLGSEVTVTNLANGRSVQVEINDRGPYVAGRVIDLSRAAAGQLGMIEQGVAQVTIEVVPQRVAASR